MLREEKEKKTCKKKTKVMYGKIEESSQVCGQKHRENKMCGDTESLH